jgi:hypothetical protein
MSNDFDNIPTLTIDLGTLMEARDVCKLMEQARVTEYVYAFVHKSGVMKIGMSCDEEWRRGSGSYGERIYRQSHHIPGWMSQAGPNTSGLDIKELFEYYPNINKKDIIIRVWNMSGYKWRCYDKREEDVKKLEGFIIDQYTNLYGRRPIGNKQDMQYTKHKAIVSDDVINNLFQGNIV